MVAPVAAAGIGLLGSLFGASAQSRAARAQAEADAARLAEEKRVREQLRADTEAQRGVADQAFADYQSGLIDYATAQERAGQAIAGVQSQIGQNQLSDVAKMQEMSQFKPYAIRSGVGNTFFDQATGQAGVNLSPEMQAYQQGLLGQAGQAAGSIAATPEQAAAQYMQQQQGLLQPGRQAEDIALRQNQLARGRIGLGISSEAAGAGAGGMVNPEQFSQDRARALADAQIAANATQAGQQQAANQLELTKGLFGAGMAPETYGMDTLKTGFGFGQTQAGIGLNQANLYGNSMNDYYRSLLGASQTEQEAGLAIPGAERAGLQEGYQRQQTYLGQLQGNQLPYQAMTTPKATVPGSAYALAGLGSGMMNIGMQGLQQAFMPNSVTGVSPYQMQQYQNQADYQLYDNPNGVVAF